MSKNPNSKDSAYPSKCLKENCWERNQSLLYLSQCADYLLIGWWQGNRAESENETCSVVSDSL